MGNYELICRKLEAFIRKYYVNELIKGAILFFAAGLLYFLLLVFLEYFFWMGKTARALLFWSFVAVGIGLFVKFIAIPLFRLFKLSKGIGYEKASSIIGNHFPEVNDKLLNVLQLKRQGGDSDLLLASIDQKAARLKPVPFNIAINFKGNLKYAKYAAIPVLVVLAIYISGKSSLFSNSYERIVNYKQTYQPPAPFQFFVDNSSLKALQNEAFTLEILTRGKVVPEDVSIHFNSETYFLKSVSPGVFEYTFEQVSKPVSFYLSANELRSRNYTLDIVEVPVLLDFKLQLDYPAYTQKRDETIKGSGNATFPEGTEITWNLKARSTDRIKLGLRDTLLFFEKTKNGFSHHQRFYRDTEYQISTSNASVENYEKLTYQFRAVQDEYPKMELEMKLDTVNRQKMYFKGNVSDDYGLSKLEVVFFPLNNPKAVTTKPIEVSKTTFDEFLYAFPNKSLLLQEGTAYGFYFQVFDNDGVNGAKKVKSQTFSFRKLTKEEKETKQLENQQETIQGMDQSLEKIKSFEKEISELNRLQKEQKRWSYTDRKKLENFLERQKKQRQMMMDYNKDLQKNLEEFQPKDKKDPYKKELQERLERNEKKLKENEELLKKLEKYAKKINKENLGKELEELAKQNINQQKSLEQLLELTKRYYVEQKAGKIADKLKKLSQEQKKLSEQKAENTKAAQDSLNQAFQKIKKEMDALKKENQGLKKPMKLGMNEKKEQQITESQQAASKKLQESQQAQSKKQQQSKSGAHQKQKDAAKKMQELAKKMQSMMMMASAQGQKEDAEMLRQILENLITFSFQQEALMEGFQEIQQNNPSYVDKLKRQNVLRTNFEHVDDSLYALALRNPIISGKIIEKLTDIKFNLDKSIERLADNKIRQGISNQQYTVTGANDLALMLDRALQNMQMQMKGMGMGKGKKGKGRGFQLPDIIKKQGELGKKMKQGMQQGKSGKGKQGKSGKQGKNGKQGKHGKSKSGQGNKGGQGQPGNKEGKNGLNREQMSGEIYEIYKQQQQLRKALEDKIRQLGLGRSAKELAEQMKQTENELLRKGFNQQTLEKILSLQHQLMKLEKATYKQGTKMKRKSKTNRETFQNTTNTDLQKAEEYFNTTEILNRQRLPLRQNYEDLVEEYFKGK